MVLLDPAERPEQTVLPITGNRLRLAIAIGFELAASDTYLLAPPTRGEDSERRGALA
jgi:hypothetical protein